MTTSEMEKTQSQSQSLVMSILPTTGAKSILQGCNVMGIYECLILSHFLEIAWIQWNRILDPYFERFKKHLSEQHATKCG